LHPTLAGTWTLLYHPITDDGRVDVLRTSAKGTVTMARPKAAQPKAPKKTATQQAARTAQIKQTANLFKQAADPTRLQTLLLLAEESRSVGALVAALGSQSQPACSHHLAILRNSRLVEPRRAGKQNIYNLTDEGRALADAAGGLMGSGAGKVGGETAHVRTYAGNGRVPTVEG
jgi:DNA-binding transcriptional ArsR family regulator